jgi:hypothetical protein
MMARVIVLDTFPLSSTAKQEPRPGARLRVLDQCHQWIKDCIRGGNRVVAPAMAYYEALRELERLNATSQIARLRTFCHSMPDRYLSLTDTDIDLAARLWAQARNAGTPTAGAEALDGDVILAAQTLNMGIPTSDIIVATTNVGHLSQFVPCDLWTNIMP